MSLTRIVGNFPFTSPVTQRKPKIISATRCAALIWSKTYHTASVLTHFYSFVAQQWHLVFAWVKTKKIRWNARPAFEVHTKGRRKRNDELRKQKRNAFRVRDTGRRERQRKEAQRIRQRLWCRSEDR